jgi:hypothetical protein
MTHHSLLPAILTLAGLIATAPAQIVFGPVRSQPGESIRLLSHSETTGGTITRTNRGQTSRGTISITRDRDLVWTFRPPAADGTKRGMVKVNTSILTTSTKLGGKEEGGADPSPLTGKMFSMEKAPTGDWKFQLDGSVPLARVRQEIDELTVYLKRDWYPAKPVALGDSWEFDPAWIKMIIHRDLEKAQIIGTMNLRQIRRAAGREMAVIDVKIRSTGSDFRPDGTEVDATLDLSGQVTVNLATMLDEVMELKGTVVSTTSTALESNKVTLPISLKVTKSFVRDP